jgi:hypothetical protein
MCNYPIAYQKFMLLFREVDMAKASKSVKTAKLGTLAISNAQIDKLLKGLSKRLVLVSDDSLKHLMDRGLISADQFARAGCCKPDGGTCCPNAHIVGKK